MRNKEYVFGPFYFDRSGVDITLKVILNFMDIYVSLNNSKVIRRNARWLLCLTAFS